MQSTFIVKLFISPFLFFILFFSASSLFAQTTLPPPPQTPAAPAVPPGVPAPNPGAPVPGTQVCLQSPFENIQSLVMFIEELLKIVVKVGLPIAAVAIIWAGVLFILAQGNEQRLTKAKKAFMWAIIGTAVLLGSWVLALAIEGTIRSIGASGSGAGGGAATCVPAM